jgi:hypothetical protein
VNTNQVLLQVAEERQRQNEKWGQQNHDDPMWGLILGEKVGEACQAALHCMFPPRNTTLGRLEQRDQLRTELIQVAAVAVAWIEALDRRCQRPDECDQPTTCDGCPYDGAGDKP